MSSALHGTPLLRRVIAEHRRRVVILAVVLLANVVAFAAVVYPLSQRVANVEQRNEAAEQALAAARADHAQTAGTLTGKAQAATELETFYERVLPPHLAGARRMTLVRFAQLARQNDLDLVGTRHYEPEDVRGSTLARLKMRLGVAGEYGDIRSFIHQLEAAPEFIVIDRVDLAEGSDEGGSIRLSLELSTYYRDPS